MIVHTPGTRSSRPRALHGDDGGAGVETAIAITGLLLVLFFVVGGMRIVGANGDVSSAARAGARAAATARTPSQADDAARSVIVASLGDRGVACSGGPVVIVDGAGVPNSAVTVTVTCSVALEDVVISGFPGSRSVSVSAVEFTDGIRGSR